MKVNLFCYDNQEQLMTAIDLFSIWGNLHFLYVQRNNWFHLGISFGNKAPFLGQIKTC